MKKLILKGAILIAVALNITGCIQYVDGVVQIPDSGIVEKNKTIKLYYEDTNNGVIREDLKNMVEFLNNSNEFKPVLIPTFSNTTADIENADDIKCKYVNNGENKSIRLKFKLDDKTNYLIADKTYTTRKDAYMDFYMTWQYLFEQTKNKPEMKDKFGYGSMLYIDELALNSGILKITTKKELSRERLQERTEIAFKQSGYTIVNTPDEADKIVYFQITRDYLESELKQLKSEGKGVNYGVVSAGISNQTNKMETGMSLGRMSNSSGTAVGVGLGVGIAFAILDAGTDHNIILPSLKITDKNDKKSYLFVPTAFSYLYVNTTDNRKFKEYFKGDDEMYYFARLRTITENTNNYKNNPID